MDAQRNGASPADSTPHKEETSWQETTVRNPVGHPLPLSEEMFRVADLLERAGKTDLQDPQLQASLQLLNEVIQNRDSTRGIFQQPERADADESEAHAGKRQITGILENAENVRKILEKTPEPLNHPNHPFAGERRKRLLQQAAILEDALAHAAHDLSEPDVPWERVTRDLEQATEQAHAIANALTGKDGGDGAWEYKHEVDVVMTNLAEILQRLHERSGRETTLRFDLAHPRSAARRPRQGEDWTGSSRLRKH